MVLWPGHGYWPRTPDGHPCQPSAETAPGQDPGPWKSTKEQDPPRLESLIHCEFVDHRVEIYSGKIKIWRITEKMFNLFLCPLQICSSFLAKELKSGLWITYFDSKMFMLVYLQGYK